MNWLRTAGFLSTLSLRRATLEIPLVCLAIRNFYPRSPCGERPFEKFEGVVATKISIHALLAESDLAGPSGPAFLFNFYPRSPCGERHRVRRRPVPRDNFYPRSPCGERPSARPETRQRDAISIHALLAESDGRHRGNDRRPINFYPRSPCGERPCTTTTTICTALFLSTLSLRRATQPNAGGFQPVHISIHALLAESDRLPTALRTPHQNFYPRSPCGERLINTYHRIFGEGISIHALLAESDYILTISICTASKFLSTLSLRRATASNQPERQARHISIHALLAESDSKSAQNNGALLHI